MQGLESTRTQCPVCWESIELLVDCSQPEQHYVEDCPVCCHPMVIRVTCESGILSTISVEAE